MEDRRRMSSLFRLASSVIFALVNLVGVVAFLYPFWLPMQKTGDEFGGHAGDAVIVFGLLVSLCLLVILAEAAGGQMDTKIIAVLGVLTAINSVARLAGNVVRLPGGFSPIFLLIILVGYVYGSRLGFLLGTFTLAVSALLVAGIGPWLPYEMFAAGWVGLTAGWLKGFPPGGKAEIAVLAAFGLIWGFLYGAITNLYFWPFVVGAGGSWEPGLGLVETLRRYAGFYLATSLVWDLMAAAGNVALIAVLGPPLLRALWRFQRRFQFEIVPEIV